MEISPINSISVQTINWRNMTARQILEYNQIGIEPPDVYLNWATEFLNSVSAGQDDNVTYENAVTSPSGANNTEGENLDSQDSVATDESGDSLDENDTLTPTIENVEDQENVPELTKAQQKRELMQEKGLNIRSQAISFTNDSNILANNAKNSGEEISIQEQSSNDEIQILTENMEQILSKAREDQNSLKAKIDSVNSSENGISIFEQIEQLQQRIRNAGKDGQASIAQTLNTLSLIRDSILSKSDIILDADDFGSITKEIGQELINKSQAELLFMSFIDRIIGTRALNAGEKSISESLNSAQIQANADAVNSENIYTANDLTSEIEDITGVQSINAGQKNDSASNENNEITQIETKDEKQDRTGITAAQNDGTNESEVHKLAIDEILKRKIRKGLTES